MTYYCLISECSNIGRNHVFDPQFHSTHCVVIDSISKLRAELNEYNYVFDIYPNDIYTKQQDREYTDDSNNGITNENVGMYFTYITEPNKTKKDYIDHIVQNITHNTYADKLFSFTKLSLNYDCCELYMYVTTKKEKIVSRDEMQYVLFTNNENKALQKLFSTENL